MAVVGNVSIVKVNQIPIKMLKIIWILMLASLQLIAARPGFLHEPYHHVDPWLLPYHHHHHHHAEPLLHHHHVAKLVHVPAAISHQSSTVVHSVPHTIIKPVVLPVVKTIIHPPILPAYHHHPAPIIKAYHPYPLDPFHHDFHHHLH